MHCTFYRPATVNTTEFENIIGKLCYDLHRLETEQHDEWSVYTYFYDLSRHALPFEKNPAMSFLGFGAPESMPSDARVAYVYHPTYIATAFMMKAVLLYPSLMDEASFLDSDLDLTVDTVKKTLAACMLACTGRHFDGAGVRCLKDCLKIFEDAGATEFVEKYPRLCPAFAELYKEKRDFIAHGGIDASEAWLNGGYKK